MTQVQKASPKNLSKHCLINDQKQEPWETLGNPPPVSQPVLPVPTFLCEQTNREPDLLILLHLSASFQLSALFCCHAQLFEHS